MSLKYETKVGCWSALPHHNMVYYRHGCAHRLDGPAKSWYASMVKLGGVLWYTYGHVGSES